MTGLANFFVTGLPMLVCGALLGWLAEWLFDIWFWRKRLLASESNLEIATKQVTTLESENNRIGGDLKNARVEYDDLNTRFLSRNTEYDDLSLRFDNTTAELGTLTTERDDLNLRFGNLNNELTTVRETSDGYETELQDLRVKFIERSKEVKEKEGLVMGLRTEIDTLKTSVADRDSQIDGLQVNLATLDTDVNKLKGQIEDKDRDIDSLNVHIADRDGEIKTLTKTVSEKEQAIKGHVESGDRVGDMQDRLNVLEDENQGLRKTLSASNKEMGDIRSKLGIGAGVGIAGILATKLADAGDSEEKQGLVTRVGELETEVATLEAKKAELEADLESSNKFLGSYAKATDSLQADLSATQADQSDSDNNAVWLETYIDTSNALQAEVDEKSALLAGGGSDVNWKPKVDELQSSVNRLEDENTALRRTVLSRNTLLDELRSDLNVNPEDDLRASVNETLGLRSTVTGLEGDVEGRNARIAELEAQLAGLEARLSTTQSSSTSASNDLTAQLEELQFRADTLDAENSALRRTLLGYQKGGDGNDASASGASVVTRFVPTGGGASGGDDAESAALRNLVRDKEGEIDDLNVQLADAIEVSRTRGGDLDRLSDENAELRNQLADAKAGSSTKTGKSSKRKSDRDDLTVIHGIGPAYQRRLYEGGITTYAQLCAATPDQVTGIIKPKEWQVIEAADWIEDACTLKGGGTPPDRKSERSSSDADSGSGSAGSAGGGKSSAVRVTASSSKSSSSNKSASGSTSGSRYSGQRDNFTVIHGIGPAFQSRLYDAGIYTYAQLGALTSDQVTEYISPEDWQLIESAEWIEDATILAGGGTPADRSTVDESGGKSSGSGRKEAQVLSKKSAKSSSTSSGKSGKGERDNLTKINGIGKVYQGKLNSAGIYTWAQLAATDADRLTEIISPADWQVIEPDSWKVQAGEFARKKEARNA